MIQNVILTRNAVVTLNVVIKSVKKRWVTDTTSLSVLKPVWLDQILFELSALIKNPIFEPQTQERQAATFTYLYNMFAKESPLMIDLHVYIFLETIEWLIRIEIDMHLSLWLFILGQISHFQICLRQKKARKPCVRRWIWKCPRRASKRSSQGCRWKQVCRRRYRSS